MCWVSISKALFMPRLLYFDFKVRYFGKKKSVTTAIHLAKFTLKIIFKNCTERKGEPSLFLEYKKNKWQKILKIIAH